MSREAWGDPPDPEPQFCPLCGEREHVEGCELLAMQTRAQAAESKAARMQTALRIAREGYASEAITGLPVIAAWRERTIALIDDALGA